MFNLCLNLCSDHLLCALKNVNTEISAIHTVSQIVVKLSYRGMGVLLYDFNTLYNFCHCQFTLNLLWVQVFVAVSTYDRMSYSKMAQSLEPGRLGVKILLEFSRHFSRTATELPAQFSNTVKSVIEDTKSQMFLVSSWNCRCLIHWSQVLSQVGAAPTTSEWSTNLLPTRMHLILYI